MACGSITSWEIDGETVETVSDFIFGVLSSFLVGSEPSLEELGVTIPTVPLGEAVICGPEYGMLSCATVS